MTRKDFKLIAECIAECHNEKYDLDDTIAYFRHKLHMNNDRFNPTKFKEYILERTTPEYIPEEQAKTWAKKKARN